MTLHCVELDYEDFTFPAVAENLKSDVFYKTQYEKFAEAKLRVMMRRSSEGSKPKVWTKTVNTMRRTKMQRKMVKKKKKAEVRVFLQELRSRADEGFSVGRLMRSHIPEIGHEVKVSGKEVTAALKVSEALRAF